MDIGAELRVIEVEEIELEVSLPVADDLEEVALAPQDSARKEA